MPTEDAIWSIDFPGINEDAAEAIADSAKRLGLATDVIITDPDIEPPPGQLQLDALRVEVPDGLWGAAPTLASVQA
jgi:hypothetical protein